MSKRDILMADTAKGHEGRKILDPTGISNDVFCQMIAFLNLDPHPQFTKDDAEILIQECSKIALCIGQMDSGQRGNKNNLDFDEIPFIQTRIVTLAMRLCMSGQLEKII